MKTQLLTVSIFISVIYVGAQPTTESAIPESASLLSEYIRHSSVSGNEQDAGQFLADICKKKNLSVRIFSDEDGNYNFSASLYPLSEEKPNIIFFNHIDVVPPGDTSEWLHPPFSGKIADGVVWGRGAIDAKGLAVMQLLALDRFRNELVEDLPYNVTLLCVSNEESTSDGARSVIGNHFDELSAVVVFGEGGAGISGLLQAKPDQKLFCISTAEKQVLWLRLSLTIKTGGHGSVPPAEYANKSMVEALARLTSKKQGIQFNEANTPMFRAIGEFEAGYRRFFLRHAPMFKPLLAGTLRDDPKILALLTNTIALTQISNAPGSTNQIAQTVSARLDCRLLPGTDEKKFVQSLTKRLRRSDIEVHVENQTLAAVPSAIQNRYYQSFKQAILQVYPDAKVMPYLFPAYTDNNFFRARGIPVYGIKPVYLSHEHLESIHNVNERIPIEELERGINVYHVFLNTLIFRNPVANTKISNQG